MILEKSNSITIKSKINYNYQTIKITRSRIDKGLLAIPKVFSDFLPKDNQNIKVYLDDSNKFQIKKFSSFYSSTNENRIGGLGSWFEKNQIKEGDEIILQVINKNEFIYRLVLEKKFLDRTVELQNDFDRSEDEEKTKLNIEKISNWVQIEKNQIISNEFIRLSNSGLIDIRKRVRKTENYIREIIPANIRTILGNIYNGICQVCSFTFLKKDNKPYYEIHHLNPSLGHHPKNLLLVCANCHRQFEYSNVRTFYNKDRWLVKVLFNEKEFKINQAIFKIDKYDFNKTIYL